MKAATLQKKQNISKGKIKKTIKNVIRRPDQPFWPVISNEHEESLKSILEKHRVEIPKFKKPHWKELKSIPKAERPKPPKVKMVDGMIFGIRACCNAVRNSECAAVIVEAMVTSRVILQPVLEACIAAEVPIVCLNNLRQTCAINFGLPTSCLGIKHSSIPDIKDRIYEIAKQYKLPQRISVISKDTTEPMEVIEEAIKDEPLSDSLVNVYLYRNNNKTRVFIPPLQSKKSNSIEISEELKNDRKTKIMQLNPFMRMTINRLMNNPNRDENK